MTKPMLRNSIATVGSARKEAIMKRKSRIPSIDTGSLRQKSRLSFSQEFNLEKKPVKLLVTLNIDYSDLSTDRSDKSEDQIDQTNITNINDHFSFETTIGETVGNILQKIEDKYELPKDHIMMIYDDSYLIKCLSLCDIPKLSDDPSPSVIVKFD